MALDGIILSKVREDLEKCLPIRINRISETSKTEIVFNVHAGGRRTNLVISTHSVYNHICLSDRNYTTYNDPGTFVMVLRKYILNGIIDSIEQRDYDRYLLLHIRALNALYDEKHYTLSVELMGKYANVILVDDESGKIIDALKKIPPYENTRRTILSGALFTLPESQKKKDPYSSDPDMDESLVKQLSGFSKTLEEEVRFRLSSQTYREIIEKIHSSNKLYITRTGDALNYHIIPLTYLGEEAEEWDIQKGFDELYYQNDEKERIRNITDDIYKFVRRQIKHYANKEIKLKTVLLEAQNLDEDRENGDLLYTYSNLNAKGLKEVEIEDYCGNKRVIRLDAKLSIKDNANKYYQAYQKKRKGQSYIAEQLQLTINELTYFKALEEQLSIANYNDALDIKEELGRYGYLRKINTKSKKKKKINLYQVKVDDCIITFGKNNVQNDFLTFEYAHSNDTWFHAKDYHGCHLVVNTPEPSEKIIRICANLAAFYSKGRYSGSVPVDYCLVKNIKKVKGMQAGFVTIRNQKTIYIDPEEDRSLNITAI